MTITNLPGPLQEAPLISSWLTFTKDGAVRLRSGRVELGQGNATALVQIAADELDVSPQQIALVAGDTRETPDEGFTAGSLSITVGGTCVRLASSAARQVLLSQAAQLLQSSIEELSVADGMILRAGYATDLTYWSLAKQASLDVRAADHAKPKSSVQRSVSGRSFPRIDLPARVKGAAFIHDLDLPGMLHGRTVHPPSMRSTLRTLDIDALKARRGIHHVLRDGSFVGVIADREEVAVKAARRAAENASWDVLQDAPTDYLAEIDVAGEEPEAVHETGNVNAVEGRTFDARVSRRYLAHASIGPSCAVAQLENGRLTVWSHTQGVYPLRKALADVLEMESDAVNVVHVPGAGCYGHNGADDVALDAALLARVVDGAPVRVVWSRADELGIAPLAPSMVTRASAVIDDDNRIVAMRVAANSPTHGSRPGMNGSPNLRAAAYLERPFPIINSGDVPAAAGGGADRNSIPLYAIPNLKITKRLITSLPYRTSAMRGLGASINVFAIETLMDDIAHETGLDPVQLRLNHLDDARARHVIDTVAQSANWPGTSDQGSGYGIGFARYKNAAAYCAVIARVEVDELIRLTHVWAAVDTGEVINPDGVVNQIEGGIVQSSSWALKEAVGFEGDTVSTLDWSSYPILKFSEIPEISVNLIDRPNETPLGCAEATQGPTVAAIGNAVRNALGVPVRDLPLTRDTIVSAIM